MCDIYKKHYEALIDELQERYGASKTLAIIECAEDRLEDEDSLNPKLERVGNDLEQMEV